MPRLVRPLALCYHAASDSWRHKLSLGQSTIERQVAGLTRRGYRPARLADVIGGRGRLLHVTFDDAFASTAPVIATLASRGVPSTVFVCSGLADGGGAPLVITELDGEYRQRPDEFATLSWSALRGLASEFEVEIGSHGVTHARLWELSDAEIQRELRDSKTSIEDHVGRPCRYLAYPFGLVDARVVRAARQAGYDAAFLLLNGTWNDRHALPRIDLYPGDEGLRLWIKTEPVVSLLIAELLRVKRRIKGSGGMI
jgi:peptidoglycan/xylan/chitin deacetylase (PgdA/CDA1 family)